jgi:hypothetical protein
MDGKTGQRAGHSQSVRIERAGDRGSKIAYSALKILFSMRVNQTKKDRRILRKLMARRFRRERTRRAFQRTRRPTDLNYRF